MDLLDHPTALAGYATPGHGIAPAEHLLGLPGFWPAYYGPVWDAFADDPEPFGADHADVDAAAEALYERTDVWPAYRIPLPHGRTLWVVHRNAPDDSGTDYLLTGPGLHRERELAAIEGHFRGPGLSWPDLVALAHAAPADTDGIRDPDRRLLLLLPAYGDADTPVEEALERITAALIAVGVAPQAAPAAAGRFLDHPFWESPTWPEPGGSPLSGGSGAPPPIRQTLLSAPPGTP
ncbi:hypothetical protein [Streptomyces sp. DSM 15324]|uniref:hypothetical protein n=1 Tax=Streptomyces sp. DSM 15324 TaxID=1739111 RepID=UPI000746F6F2|nr:hypothetical protein [Streptomyces sp. DSM 15324]KUO11099.1 hypothetical protein AQJ58_16285 [Streptomyces sp. DSM 15324]